MNSKLGLHGIMSTGTLDVLSSVTAQGSKIATIKAVEGVEWLQEVKQISPETITVGRYIRGEGGVEVEGPPLDGDLRTTAQQVMASLFPKWEPHREYVDYWEVVNEADPAGPDGHRRLAELMNYCMELAEAEGYHLALFSYSTGVPEWEEWQAIVETGVFGRAKAGGHALALHEYAYPMNKWYGEPLPGHPKYPNRGVLAVRYRWLYEDFLKPRGEVVPLFITEANLAHNLAQVSAADWLKQMRWYDERLLEDDYVVGAHLFTLGSGGGWQTYDFTKMLPELTGYLVARGRPPVVPSVPPDTHPMPEPITPPVETDGPAPAPQETQGTLAHYVLLPHDADWAWVNACRRYWEVFHVTLGTTLEAVAGKAAAVTVVNPQRWPVDVKAQLARRIPNMRYDPIKADSPQELAEILQWRVTARERFG